ncbi:AAA family ATPase [Roseibium sediminis]|uniref:AAA family ATPase n=1 Tax=Roseibium sediminis TaxID=1775174 RepID=UPI00123D534E|nr:AAA family ATPase [Roseibium sediminis]
MKTVIPNPALYNQSTLNDDDFVESFVARHKILEALLRRLRAQNQDEAGQHDLLVGSRGMGKTSLLRRLAIGISRDPHLSTRFIPLRFREEQYNVLSLGDFWRNCGESLAEWAEENNQQELADQLDEEMVSEKWKSDGGAEEAFREALRCLNRRAILLVDNLDLILDALRDEEHWTLRRHLQDREGSILIGAATQSLQQSADSKAAFYEFFQPHHMDPLDARETEECMRSLAERRGEHGEPVIQILDTQPERLKVLHTLTGGNPRVLTLIYRLLETEESDAAMADLELLLDQVTPYYKARVEEYQTPQQRAIIDAIALHWDPVTTGKLSEITGITSTTLSPQLSRLRKDGLIESVETSGSYKGHQITERFLNIWYLMRHGTRRTKQKLRWLVSFLTCFYARNELDIIAAKFSALAQRTDRQKQFKTALDIALEQSSDVHQAAQRIKDFIVEKPTESLEIKKKFIKTLRKKNDIYFFSGLMLLDFTNEYNIAKDMLSFIEYESSDYYKFELAWAYLLSDESANIKITKEEKSNNKTRVQFIQSAEFILERKIDKSLEYLGKILNEKEFQLTIFNQIDCVRLFRLFEMHGEGENLLSWLKETGQAEVNTPLFVAYSAYLYGKDQIKDVNPEVRATAQTLFNLLDAPRQYAKVSGDNER